MSESRFHCFKCPERHFSNLVEAVKHVISETAKGKGSKRVYVQCCIKGCLIEKVRKSKLRLHIRKSHTRHCPVPCLDCKAKFVEQRDLDNHRRNGCPRRKQTRLIDTFFINVDFSDSSTVNRFINTTLQLDEANRKAVSEAVDSLCKYLQHNLPSFSINKFVKGGSVGKGTAVKDKADIDCVVFLNNVKTMEEHKLNLKKPKKALKSCLKQSPDEDQITIEGLTKFAVKFKFRLDSTSPKFDVDLLPTFTTNQTLEQLYEEMIRCKTEDRDFYSAHFVGLQVEFVKRQLPIVKDLIRLVKYWRKTCIKDTRKTRLPHSYPLELITIHCWEEAGKPESFDIRAGFKAVLQQLFDNCVINVCHGWDHEYYSEALARRGIKAMNKKNKRRPFVLDPANPTNNVCSASDPKGWKIVANVAKMTLERHPLKDIIFEENWQIKQVQDNQEAP